MVSNAGVSTASVLRRSAVAKNISAAKQTTTPEHRGTVFRERILTFKLDYLIDYWVGQRADAFNVNGNGIAIF